MLLCQILKIEKINSIMRLIRFIVPLNNVNAFGKPELMDNLKDISALKNFIMIGCVLSFQYDCALLLLSLG
jgi:hypothetical protein